MFAILIKRGSSAPGCTSYAHWLDQAAPYALYLPVENHEWSDATFVGMLRPCGDTRPSTPKTPVLPIEAVLRMTLWRPSNHHRAYILKGSCTIWEHTDPLSWRVKGLLGVLSKIDGPCFQPHCITFMVCLWASKEVWRQPRCQWKAKKLIFHLVIARGTHSHEVLHFRLM